MDSSAIYENNYNLETIMTAPHPSVLGFTEAGDVVYAEETRKKEDIECFQRAQEGIFDYFKTYIYLCPKEERKLNRKLGEAFLNLIHRFVITDESFLDLVVEDPFFNRRTNITDVLSV